jgi:hypothetical protein
VNFIICTLDTYYDDDEIKEDEINGRSNMRKIKENRCGPETVR